MVLIGCVHVCKGMCALTKPVWSKQPFVEENGDIRKEYPTPVKGRVVNSGSHV